MTTYTLSGFGVYDIPVSLPGESGSVSAGLTLELSVADGAAFSFSPTRIREGSVDFEPGDGVSGLVRTRETSPDGTVTVGVSDIGYTLSEITWSGGTTVILTMHSGGVYQGIYALSGAPLPDVESYSDYEAFDASITKRSPVTTSLEPNQTMDWDPNITGSSEDDVLTGKAWADTLTGGDGNDTIFGGDGSDKVNGGKGEDKLAGNTGHDTLFGRKGDDRLNGGKGQDSLDGGSGSDTLRGGTGKDSLHGGQGDDLLKGGTGNDTLDGRDGHDTLWGGSGDDDLTGRGGGDRLEGDAGNDTLRGSKGDDDLAGGNGDDVLRGGSFTQEFWLPPIGFVVAAPTYGMILEDTGKDTLDGGQGRDTLDGGYGDDLLTGGDGGDAFVFFDGFGHDTITDFDAASSREKIDLSTVSSITDMADLLGSHMRQDGGNTVIEDASGNTITLENVSLADLDETDFVFSVTQDTGLDVA